MYPCLATNPAQMLIEKTALIVLKSSLHKYTALGLGPTNRAQEDNTLALTNHIQPTHCVCGSGRKGEEAWWTCGQTIMKGTQACVHCHFLLLVQGSEGRHERQWLTTMDYKSWLRKNIGGWG
jgi:hypothetical protein